MVCSNRRCEAQVNDKPMRLSQLSFPTAMPQHPSYEKRALWVCRPCSGRSILVRVRERIVADLHQRYQLPFSTTLDSKYWSDWREECLLADQILVNSEWSRQALILEGIESEKIRIVELAYQTTNQPSNTAKEYPSSFSRARPLRVLFLGQIVVRKGIMELSAAIRELKNEPIEWTFVGGGDQNLLDSLRTLPSTHVIGNVLRDDVHQYYANADVFILPTHSDGFAITQLEAAALGLPIIASEFCGQVVIPNQNGLLLKEVTSNAIVDAVKFCLRHPDQLQAMSRFLLRNPPRGIDDLSHQLTEMVRALGSQRNRPGRELIDHVPPVMFMGQPISPFRHGTNLKAMSSVSYPPTQDFAAYFAELLRQRVPPNASVLDIGCGPSLHPALQKIRPHFAHLTGVDPGEDVFENHFLDRAFQKPFEDFEWEGPLFDAAYSYNVLEHLADPERFARKLATVVKPGGWFWALTPHANHPFARLSRFVEILGMKSAYRSFMRTEDGYHGINDYPAYYRLNNIASVRRNMMIAGSGFDAAEFTLLDARWIPIFRCRSSGCLPSSTMSFFVCFPSSDCCSCLAFA